MFELQPVLDAVVENATRLCAGDQADLIRVEGEDVYEVAHFGLAPAEYREVLDRKRYSADRGSLVGRTILERRPVLIPDVEADTEYRFWEAVRPFGFRALLGIPLMRDDKLIGVLAVSRREPRPFNEQEIRLAQTFADQAAIAIANTRLIEAVERQRTELSRFVSPQVAELISSKDGQQLLAGHRPVLGEEHVPSSRATTASASPHGAADYRS